MKKAFLVILLLVFVFQGGNVGAEELIVDHSSVQQFDNIPASWIEKAKQDFRVSYGHTSHGSQIVSGMTLLKNDASYSGLFSFYDDYYGGLPADNLSFWDRKMSGASDLGNPNRTAWATATRDHLDNVGSNRNLIMWSWCGQVSSATEAQIANDYLANMEQLEADYPNVTFIYMTGHLNGSGPSGNLYQRNNQIREYCQNNDKILFDFADIESWDPAGNYYPDESDSCGWCSTWCSSHECPSCSCAHSHCFNCYLKGKAFWWMLARLAGWTGDAQIFYVDKENAGCLDSKPGTEAEPWCTLAKAAATAQAGDTVLIKAGEYNEVLKPANSGVASSPITFKSHVNGEAIIKDVSSYDERVLSHPSDPNPYYGPIWLEDNEYIVIDGINLTGGTNGYIRSVHSNNNTIKNCHFKDSTRGGKIGGAYFFESHNNRIENCTIEGDSDSMALIYSNGNVVQNNTFGKARHVLLTIKCGSNNVVRNNYFYNELQKIMEIFDCEHATMFYHGNIPYNQDNPILDSTKYNLVEGNEFAYTPSSGDHSPYSGIQYAGQKGIIRKNLFYETVGPGLSLTYYPTEAMYNYGNRIYNNVFYKTDFAGISISGTTSSNFQDQVIKNNILAKSIFVANDTRWSWYTEELAGKPVQVMTGRRDDFVFEKNNLFNQTSGESYLITYGTRSSSSNPPQQNVEWWQSNYPEVFKNNLELDPLFANPQEHDFRLVQGSPMIDEGAFLTQTTNSGNNSTTMAVEDAGYFYDGFGIPGETGDVIQLEGQTQTATITSINYTNNILTLSNPLTWTTNQKISLAYTGNAPDLGAIEFTDSGTTCANTDTSCGTYPNCINCNSQDGCSENTYRNYYCSGNTCSYTEDNCSDCSCSCGGYNTPESTANNNCSDGKDNDCDSLTDAADTECEEPETCGNGTIDTGENCENCPQDVPCTTGEICCAAACITPECTQDTDCLTEQHCTNPGTCNATCTDCNIVCYNDAECDDQDPETTDTCINQGTCEAFCRNEPVTCGGQTCSTGQICCNNTCTTPTCNSTTECNDQDQCTRDYCSQAGTCNANCTHTEIQKCGWKNMTWVLPSCFPINDLFEVTVTDKQGNPLQDVTIEYGTQTETTDATGKTELTGEKAKYLINANKEGYHPLNGKKIATTTCNPTYTTTNGKPPTTGREKINIQIIDTPYIGKQFTLTITDKDGNPIQGATVEYSNQTVTTDQTGQASLTGEKAKYLITATATQGKETTKILPKTYTETTDQNLSGNGTTEQPLALPLDIIALVAVIAIGALFLIRERNLRTRE